MSAAGWEPCPNRRNCSIRFCPKKNCCRSLRQSRAYSRDWAKSKLARPHHGDNVRTTVEQNLVLRWISEADLPELYRELKRIGLAEPGAGTIVDIVACPGTDTCKLGIASSRGLAGEIRSRLSEKFFKLDDAIKNLHIKISGCFNSCGQHHIADLGFYGTSRTIGNRKAPHFQGGL